MKPEGPGMDRRSGRATSDERLHAELRLWARDRDFGPAPERLRVRVAQVAEQSVDVRRSRVLRAMAGLAAAAALAVVLITALALRLSPTVGPAASSDNGPAVSVSPAPPSASWSASPELTPALPYGTWAPGRSVPAVPMGDDSIDALALTLLLAGAGLLLLVGLRTALDLPVWEDESPSDIVRTLLRRAWPWRLASIVMAAILVAGGAGLLQVSQSTPLVYGPYVGGGSSFLGFAGDRDAMYDSYIPGAEEQVGISVMNDGDLPLTVTALDVDRFRAKEPAFSAFVESVELRLPPGATEWGGTWTEPFHPFELPPRSFTSLTLVLKLRECPSTVAAGPPVPSPGSISGDYTPTTGTVGFQILPFRYSVLGIERVADLRMNTTILFVFGNHPVSCGG